MSTRRDHLETEIISFGAHLDLKERNVPDSRRQLGAAQGVG